MTHVCSESSWHGCGLHTHLEVQVPFPSKRTQPKLKERPPTRTVATLPTSARSAATAATTATTVPTGTTTAADLPYELIAARAYEKWQNRGCPMGQDGRSDWYAARAELEQERLRWAPPEDEDRNRI
jgi:hypothetical protein